MVDVKRLDLRKLDFHPLIFAIYPILFLFANNIDKAEPQELILPSVISISGAALIWLISWMLLRNIRKSAIVTTLMLFLFFSYGHILKIAESANAEGSESSQRATFLLIVYLIILIVGAVMIRQAKKPLDQIGTFLNLAGGVLISFSFASILYYQFAQPPQTLSPEPEKPPAQTVAAKSDKYPNIFLLVLDGYGREDVLKKYYDYDNSELLDHLRKKGFYIADKSTSNYPRTNLSIPSMLNSAYVQSLLPNANPESSDTKPLSQLQEAPLVATFLKQFGYSFVSFGTGYSGTEVRKADKLFIAPGSLSEFQNMVLNTTPLTAILRSITGSVSFQFERRRQQLLWTFEHLPDMARSKTPVFVYSHLLLPHPAFIFGPNGEPKNPEHTRSTENGDGSHYYQIPGNTKQGYINDYRDQLHFENKLLKQTIDKILAVSEEPPIIIIQSDHGPGSEFDHWAAEKTNLEERMSILNAFYFPDQDYNQLYTTITPVNNFRVVFDQYFQDTELLPDLNFYAAINTPYKFIDVSDQVKRD